MIPDRLEVAADEQQRDRVAVALLEVVDLAVDGVELAVAAPFDGDLRRRGQCAVSDGREGAPSWWW